MSSNTATLGQIQITNDIVNVPQRATARIAGVLYLIIIVAGIFAEFFVRQSLKVPGDAGATAANIMASDGMLQMAIAADLMMILADIAIALAFYALLKPVSNALSLLAAFFRLGQAAVLSVNLLGLLFVLQLLSGADYLSVFNTDQLQAAALFLFNGHAIGYSLAMIPFAFSLLVLGYLIFKSGYFPKILVILFVLASVGYLIDSFGGLLVSNYDAVRAVFDVVLFAFIGEFAMCLWLLIKGVKTR